jgi:hypothetical protein
VPDAYESKPARYAKNMVAVSTPSTDGYKTRAARLASYFARDRYSHRERAYIMSSSAAAKFEQHYASGWDASTLGRRLIPPRETV